MSRLGCSLRQFINRRKLINSRIRKTHKLFRNVSCFVGLKTLFHGLARFNKILLKIDNTSTVSWVNKQSDPDKEIFTLVKQFWEFCIDRNINVVASYIESKKNKVADKESRKIRDNLEWTLKDKHFENINREFGEFTIDLFATRINSKCRRYYSYSPEPEAAGTDASYATGIRKTSMHFLLLV